MAALPRTDHRASIVYEHTNGCASAPIKRQWQRRTPEQTALWQVVARELPDFASRIGRETGRSLPIHVERELLGYLRCGLLEHGFARVRCRECHDEILVAFSCKGRSLCPSCTARRMSDVAAHLVDRVVPNVPIRQWVITFPRKIRWHLAHDPKLASEAISTCMRVIFAWQRRAARQRGIDFGAPSRSQSARCGAIAFLQRFDSALSLDFHLHALLPDGVFARESDDPDARPRFHRLPPPTEDDVETLLRKIAEKISALLRRRGRLDDDNAPNPDDTQASFERFAARSLLISNFEPTPPPPLCARIDGFSLHAARSIHEHDREGLERLARYCARPAISLDRLSLQGDGQVRYKMKRVFSDGRSEVVLSPHDFLARLCALVPPPRAHQLRYFGAFAPRARGRAALTGQTIKIPTQSPPTLDDKLIQTSSSSAPKPESAAPIFDDNSPLATLGDPPPDADRARYLDSPHSSREFSRSTFSVVAAAPVP